MVSANGEAESDLLARLRSLPIWGVVPGVALAYFFAAKYGVSIPWLVKGISPVWPPTGVALAAVLLFGYRAWPGIALGEVVELLWLLHYPLSPAVGIGLGNALEAVAGVFLFRRLGGSTTFLDRPQDVVRFALAAGLAATALGATTGALNLCLGGVAPWSAFPTVWLTWWLGDAIGAIAVTPALISWTGPLARKRHPRQMAEAVLLLALVFVVSMAIFWDWLPAGRQNYPLAYVPIPFLILAVFRFGQHGATTGILVLLAIAVWGTAQGYGPFAGRDPMVSLVLLQAFIAVAALSTMLFAAVIAQQQHAERALARTNEELRRANEHMKGVDRLKDHLLSGFSHEIKTPISLLMAYAELLHEKYPEEPLLEGIQDGSRRLTEHLNRILDYSALLSGSLHLYLTEVAPAELVKHVQALMGPALQLAGLRLRTEVQPDTPPIPADSRRVMQIVLELLENARKFTPPGGTVTIRVEPAGSEVRFQVCDTGKGFAEQELARIWEVFTQIETGDAARKGGLGLGLTIVKLLTDLHGGRVEAQSEVGTGSCFSVYLPSEPRAAAPDA